MVATSECAGPRGLGRSRGTPWPSRQTPLCSNRRQECFPSSRERLALRRLMTRQTRQGRLLPLIRPATAIISRPIYLRPSFRLRQNIADARMDRLAPADIAHRRTLTSRRARFITLAAHLLTRFPPCHNWKPGSPLSRFSCSITHQRSTLWSRVFQQPWLNGGRLMTFSPDNRRIRS